MGKRGLGKFILGAGIGTGLGLLFAPKKGSETRKDLKNKVDELMDKAKDIEFDEVKDKFEEKVDELKKELKNLDKEKVLKYAKEQGEKIKDKASELVDLAKEKGTPVLQDAAKEVKNKAINVLEETLANLEKEDKKKKEK